MGTSSRVAVLLRVPRNAAAIFPRGGTVAHAAVTVARERGHRDCDRRPTTGAPPAGSGSARARRAPAASETVDAARSWVGHRPAPTPNDRSRRLAETAPRLSGDRLVNARDGRGSRIVDPCRRVSGPMPTSTAPEHPRPIGLATATTWQAALVKGLSDRLGWEAVLEFERGAELPLRPRDGRQADGQRHRPRRTPRPRRPDRRRARRRHDALGRGVDLGGSRTPGAVRRRPGRSMRIASSTSSTNCSAQTAWRSSVSISARHG